MKFKMVARSMALAPMKLEFYILVPAVLAVARGGTGEKIGHRIATTIDTDKDVRPGEVVTLEFEWPLPDFPPRQCRFKALPHCSLAFQLITMEVDGLPLIEGSGTAPGPNERMFA